MYKMNIQSAARYATDIGPLFKGIDLDRPDEQIALDLYKNMHDSGQADPDGLDGFTEEDCQLAVRQMREWAEAQK